MSEAWRTGAGREDLFDYFSRMNEWTFEKSNLVLCCGRSGGQVVSVLAFYSDDPSSNPAEAYSISIWKEQE